MWRVTASFVRVSLCGVEFPLSHMNDENEMRGLWNLSALSPLTSCRS